MAWQATACTLLPCPKSLRASGHSVAWASCSSSGGSAHPVIDQPWRHVIYTLSIRPFAAPKTVDVRCSTLTLHKENRTEAADSYCSSLRIHATHEHLVC